MQNSKTNSGHLVRLIVLLNKGVTTNWIRFLRKDSVRYLKIDTAFRCLLTSSVFALLTNLIIHLAISSINPARLDCIKHSRKTDIDLICQWFINIQMFIMANRRANKTVQYNRDSLNPAFNIAKSNCILKL